MSLRGPRPEALGLGGVAECRALPPARSSRSLAECALQQEPVRSQALERATHLRMRCVHRRRETFDRLVAVDQSNPIAAMACLELSMEVALCTQRPGLIHDQAAATSFGVGGGRSVSRPYQFSLRACH